MAKIYEVEREEIVKQAQKIIRSVKPSAPVNDKVNMALALSVLALLAADSKVPIAQQFLKFVKNIQK